MERKGALKGYTMNDKAALKVFDSGDRPFFEWMDQHQGGIVLNTTRGPNNQYGMIHHSNCGHITDYSSYPDNGEYTERQYIKVCSEEASELWEWILQNRPNVSENLRVCKDCNPAFPMHYCPPRIPEEVEEPESYIEGGTKSISVNAYERDPRARQKCLDIYGFNCAVCDMSFQKTYGEIGASYIHVHHLVPLAGRGEKYEIKPETDLRPVCPNCHAMLHKNDPPYSIEELKEILTKHSNGPKHA